MVVNHNINSLNTINALNQNNQALSVSLQRLSTGLRINSAADDAAGLGVSQNLLKNVNGTAQATRNANDGVAALNVADGAASEIGDILQRMRELALQSSNETLTSTERTYTNDEYSQLKSEIDRISQVTNYNGMSLVGSEAAGFNNASVRFGMVTTGATSNKGGSALWIDANSTVGHDSITISIDTLSTDTLGGAASGTYLNKTYTDSLTDATQAIKTIDESINSVNQMRSNLGSYINRLNDAVANLATSNTNQTAAYSDIMDTDFAQESTDYTRNQILVQTGTAMLAQANAGPQAVLTLLK